MQEKKIAFLKRIKLTCKAFLLLSESDKKGKSTVLSIMSNDKIL